MLIGISGKMGAGKDTLAQCLQQFKTYNRSFEIKKFASKLKECAYLLTGVRDQWSQEGKQRYLLEWGMTVGEFQQKLGTEAVRDNIHPDAWIIALFSDYQEMGFYDEYSNYSVVFPDWIITDVRFPNEADAIKRRGGYLVRINGTRTKDVRDANHVSETALDSYQGFDYIFDNSTLTHEELEIHAIQIYDAVGGFS